MVKDVQAGGCCSPRGKVASLWGVLLVSGLSLCGAPVNDDFASATPLSGAVLLATNNVGASIEPGEPMHDGQAGEASVWWSWTATHDGEVSIFASSGDFTPLLAVYSGAALPSLVAVIDAESSQSRVRFAAVSGGAYAIAVAGKSLQAGQAVEGNFQLGISDNYRFEDRIVLTGTNIVVHGHNVGAGIMSQTVWWSWTAPGPGTLRVSVSGNVWPEGSSLETRLQVYTGSSQENLTSVLDRRSDFFSPTNSGVVPVAADAAYQIAVGGKHPFGFGGLFRLVLEFTPAPVNDLFADRLEIVGSSATLMASNAGASREPGEPAHVGAITGRSVWWTWTAPTDGNLTVAMSGNITQKLLAIYAGDALTNLTLGDSSFALADLDPTNRVSLEVRAGTAYQIAVDSRSVPGDFILNLRFTPVGGNDQFADRILLRGTNLVVAWSNSGATAELGEPAHGVDPAAHSVWWYWTAPHYNGLITVGVPDGSKSIGVYTGTELGSLTPYSVEKTSNEVKFVALRFTTYLLAIDGAPGTFHLALTFTRVPANDDFAGPLPLVGSVARAVGDNVLATSEGFEPAHGGSGGSSVWWTWTAPENGPVVLATAGSSFNTLLAVYTGVNLLNATSIASNDDYLDQTSQLAFEAVAGMAYAIAVDGWMRATGQIVLTLSQQGAAQVSSIALADGAFQCSLLGQANTNYVIDASTNLIDWTTLATLTNTFGTSFFADPDAGHYPYRFYRALLDRSGELGGGRRPEAMPSPQSPVLNSQWS